MPTDALLSKHKYYVLWIYEYKGRDRQHIFKSSTICKVVLQDLI